MQDLYLMQRWRVRGDFYFFQGLHIFLRGDSLIKNQHVQHRQPKSTMFLVCCSEPEPNCSPTELHLSWWAPPPCWGAFGKDAVTSSITRLVKKSKLSSIYFHPEATVSTFCSWALLRPSNRPYTDWERSSNTEQSGLHAMQNGALCLLPRKQIAICIVLYLS